jgi:hypothetical protein
MRHSHKMSQRWIQAALVLAITGGISFYIVLVQLWPETAIFVGWLIFLAGLAVLFIGVCWQTYVALCEDTTCAVLSIVLFPGYLVYYAMTRWSKAWLPFVVVVGGAAMCAGALLGVFSADRLKAERENPRSAIASQSVPPLRTAASGAAARAGQEKSRLSARADNAPVPGLTAGKRSPMAGQRTNADEDIPPATDLISLDGAKHPTAPPADPSQNPMEKALEDASRIGIAKIAVDLAAGDDAALQARMLWFPLGNRACMGFRFGVGAQASGPRPASNSGLNKLIGAITLTLVGGLEQRMVAKTFGPWPPEVMGQVAILKPGGPADLLVSARRRGLDLLFALDVVPPGLPNPKPAEAVRVSLIDVLEGQTLSTWYASAATEGGKGDPAAGIAAEIFKFADTNLALVEIPWLIADKVTSRMRVLAGMTPKLQNSAAALVEVRLYQVKRFLQPDKATPLYEAILGRGRGPAMSTGDAAQRREVLDAWLREL